jgi:pimeloyl-ACP methyl ester carboxylesterase
VEGAVSSFQPAGHQAWALLAFHGWTDGHILDTVNLDCASIHIFGSFYKNCEAFLSQNSDDGCHGRFQITATDKHTLIHKRECRRKDIGESPGSTKMEQLSISTHSSTETASQPLLSDFHLETIEANGITHRVATVKGYHPRDKSGGTLILLLHGWPEGWYAWRHQLRALAKAGYVVCAPDMRGFGGTSAPTAVRDYRIDILCQDVVSVAHTILGDSRKIIPIGHDFGAYVAWHLALLHPDMVTAVCGMAVPFLGHSPSKEGLLVKLQSSYAYGKSLPQPPYCASPEEQEQSLFHYMLYHNLEHAAEQFDRNAYEALYRIYYYRPGIPSDPPGVTSKKMFLQGAASIAERNNIGSSVPLDARSSAGMWDRAPRPKEFPSWQGKDDFTYMLQQYRDSGFAGGLNWYKVIDANWAHTKPLLKGKKIVQPALFMCGKEDRVVLNIHGGLENVVKGMERHCTQLLKFVALEDTGHWCQQEQPETVNRQLLGFLKSVSACSLSKL